MSDMSFDDDTPDLDEDAMKHGHSFTHSPHHHTGIMPSPGPFPLDPSSLPHVELDPPSNGY